MLTCPVCKQILTLSDGEYHYCRTPSCTFRLREVNGEIEVALKCKKHDGYFTHNCPKCREEK